MCRSIGRSSSGFTARRARTDGRCLSRSSPTRSKSSARKAFAVRGGRSATARTVSRLAARRGSGARLRVRAGIGAGVGTLHSRASAGALSSGGRHRSIRRLARPGRFALRRVVRPERARRRAPLALPLLSRSQQSGDVAARGAVAAARRSRPHRASSGSPAGGRGTRRDRGASRRGRSEPGRATSP